MEELQANMKIAETELSPLLRKDINLIEILNNIASILNNGRYQMRVVTSVPTHTGEQGEHLLYISGTVRRFYYWDDTNSTWQFIEHNSSGLGQSAIVATVSLTGQTGAIGATTIYTPAASGMYRVSTYVLVTTAGSAGTLDVVIGWTDDKQAQSSIVVDDLALNGAGNAGQHTLLIRSTATIITYTTTVAGVTGSPQYSLFLICERLT